jgi:hypothetical protein
MIIGRLVGAVGAIVVLFGASGVARARTAAPQRGTAPSDSAAAAAAVGAYHRALASGDTAAALALLAPDAVVLESGGAESRDEYRSHHLAADM